VLTAAIVFPVKTVAIVMAQKSVFIP